VRQKHQQQRHVLVILITRFAATPALDAPDEVSVAIRQETDGNRHR
jgi:hypothetical protein